MRDLSSLSGLSLLRRPNPGFSVFEGLLDLLPNAAVIIDMRRRRVVTANRQAVELTVLTRQELNDSSPEALFKGLDWQMLAAATEPGPDERILSLMVSPRGSRTRIELSASASRLDVEGKWVLLSFEALQDHQRRQDSANRQRRVWQAIEMLMRAPLQTELSDALRLALQAGQTAVEAPLLAIYQANGEEFALELLFAHGPGELLPVQLSPADLSALQTPYLWTRAKRALCGLHRAARGANLSYLASAPLGQPKAAIGLLLAAGDGELPPDDTLQFLTILAPMVTGLLQNASVSGGLQENVQAQARLIARQNAVSGAIQDGLVMISPDLRIMDLNPSAELILGYASHEVHGQPYQNILIGADNLFPPFIGSGPEPSVHQLGNVKLYRRDGQSFLANVRTLAISVEDELESLLVLIQDLSQEEQYRLRSQQLEQRALIGEVTAIFAHEVRNPVNNLSTGLQLLEMSLPENDPNREMAQRLQQDCERLSELMKSVLSFVRPVEYKMEAVNLEASLRAVLARWHPHMARVDIQHSLAVEPGTPPVEGDLRALEQVWNNLIGNAIQAMGKNGGSLAVRIRPVIGPSYSQRVEVSISDTGPGIPDQIRERIFEPFFTTNRNGTGLGLSITKQIITTHKGVISVASVPGGTVFQVQLPPAGKPQPKE